VVRSFLSSLFSFFEMRSDLETKTTRAWITWIEKRTRRTLDVFGFQSYRYTVRGKD